MNAHSWNWGSSLDVRAARATGSNFVGGGYNVEPRKNIIAICERTLPKQCSWHEVLVDGVHGIVYFRMYRAQWLFRSNHNRP